MHLKAVICIGLISVALGEEIPIVSLSSDVSPDGAFDWSYKSGDGTEQQQSGQLKQVGEEAGEAVSGSASWTDPEGGAHHLSYVADENGYQPQSPDIPVPPPLPAAIARSLEWIAAHPAPVE